MLRNLLLTIGIILTSSMLVFSQSGTLQGTITDKETGEGIPFANVVVELGGSQVGGSTTDFDGKYTIKPITPGEYTVRTSYVGYQTRQVDNVIISADKITFLDIHITSQATNLEVVEITSFEIPLISKDQTSSGGTVTSEEIKKMPNKSADAIATTVGGVFSEDGNVKSIRGQRSEATVYYIDGIKVSGSASLPESAIDQVSVVLGGVPAQYGDAVGGIINITTKGPSRDFSAGLSVQTSEILDAYGYNRVGLNMNGPLFTKKTGPNSYTSILGYYIAGEVVYEADNFPTSTGIYTVKEDVLKEIIQNPISISAENGAVIQNAMLLRKDSFEHKKNAQNNNSMRYNLSAKIDIKTTSTMNMSLGGSMSYLDNSRFDYRHSLFNSDLNSQDISFTRRGFFRFTNRFKNSDDNNALIKNTYISFQADFSRYTFNRQHAEFKDNLLDYGHIGKFTTHKRRNYEQLPSYDSLLGRFGVKMDSWADYLVDFEPGSYNPALARYTSSVYEMFDTPQGHYDMTNSIVLNKGLLNGMAPEDIYGLWATPGALQSGYSNYMSDQLGLDLKVSTDIGNHELRFGLIFEQRWNRNMGADPARLWTLMRDLTNAHIGQLDLKNPQATYVDGIYTDTINYFRLYDGGSQRFFDKKLRESMGLSVTGTEWIDIDSYDRTENTMKYYDESGVQHTATLNGKIGINMFSPDELLNSGAPVISAFGYNYDGTLLKGNPSFSDFFTKKDEQGNFLRHMPAFQPTYMAGYIQDKFAFKDLIFNIGIRVDRFDANQMVLKDPFLLYETYTAGEIRGMSNPVIPLDQIPDNIGNDYVVYVDSYKNPTSFSGFRNGNVWFDGKGKETTNPEASIGAGGSGIQPFLKNPDDNTVSPSVFKDYEPQISVMPRIAFSFPISDEALFFAHYDVLTQRPRGNLRMDISEYFFMPTSSGGSTYNNPNLRPEQTIDYELGFQQKLGNTSSIVMAAFYREVRDQIQAYRFSGAFPNTYYSYNNIDFGTIKGLTLTYDLRRTGNLRLKASYTLQFAEGTGSDSDFAMSLIKSDQPNLRTLLPLGIDRRHAMNVMVDYRFASGKHYNGPISTRTSGDKTKTIQWLKNTGVNLVINGGSGTPYTKSSAIYPMGGGGRRVSGSINGARKPEQVRVDMRLDRDIFLTFGKGENKRNSSLNVYLQVLNLFGTMNVMNVYDATGNAYDDGYLSAAEWETAINSKLDSEAYRNLYWMKLQNPYNYSAPRQIRVGVDFNF